ncbi:MAG: hypothetical protein WC668_04735 [Patescibacteria group bacterium]|jgi:hypothetical protein
MDKADCERLQQIIETLAELPKVGEKVLLYYHASKHSVSSFQMQEISHISGDCNGIYFFYINNNQQFLVFDQTSKLWHLAGLASRSISVIWGEELKPDFNPD